MDRDKAWSGSTQWRPWAMVSNEGANNNSQLGSPTSDWDETDGSRSGALIVMINATRLIVGGWYLYKYKWQFGCRRYAK